MKKLLIAIALIVVTTLTLPFFFLEEVVVEAVERGGTHALGVDTRLGAASIGLFSGSFELEELRIDNPPGFRDEPFLELDRGRLELEMDSFFTETVQMPLIELEGVRVDLDKGPDGANYEVLLANLERVSDGEEAPNDEPRTETEEGEGKNLIIGKIVIRQIEAQVQLSRYGGEISRVTVEVGEIVIDSPGEMTVAETYALVVRALMAAVVRGGAGLLPDVIVEDLGVGKLGNVAFDVTGEVVTGVVDLLGGAGKVSGKAGEALIEAGAELKKGLGKILSGDSD